MQVNLKGIGSKTFKIERDLPSALFKEASVEGYGSLNVLSPVKVKLQVSRADGSISLRGTVETTIGLSCSRCMEDFWYKVDTDIDIVYQPEGVFRLAGVEDAGSPARQPEREEGERLKAVDLKIATYTEPVLHVDEQIREAIHLAVPMKPLCGEECQGLCPRCGQNLNVQNCDCVRRSIDPRFAELGKFLKQDRDYPPLLRGE